MIKNIPKHIAIIPDGNRRWARKNNLPTFEGHRKGFDAIIGIARKSREMGIKILTVWAFSTENWNRSKSEIKYLMELYQIMIDKHLKEALKNKIRIVHLGRKDRLSPTLMNKIINAENKTKDFSDYYMCIALDYGGRDEILRAAKKGNIIDTNNMDSKLDTSVIPYKDPDLVIRTGGEKRLSGFMLWQIAYSELMFVDKLLPDFSPDDFEECIKKYSQRNRRFGR